MKISIICYHKVGIPKKDDPRPALFIKPFQFKLQIFLLKVLGYRTISQEELLDFLQNRKLNIRKPIVITFDDGYEDNFINAYPILKKADFTAIISICTGFIGKKNAIFENEKQIKGKLPENYLNEKKIIEMSQNGISFCSHGINHYFMDELDESSLNKEIILSKQYIEKLINKKVIFFTYPYGRYNNITIESLKNSGYYGAFTIIRGKVCRNDNPYELKRLVVKGYNKKLNFLSTIEFLYKIFFM
ncbi:MAG: polysaccharide deacetylase family protein [Burkholderiales bacterium]